MGDRTTVNIEVLDSASQAVENAFGQQADDEIEGDLPATVRLSFQEVNGGGWNLLSDLAKSGVVFRGSHGDGIEYHGMTFAAHNGALAWTRSYQGELMVGIDPQTCEVRPRNLAAPRQWREIDALVSWPHGPVLGRPALDRSFLREAAVVPACGRTDVFEVVGSAS